MITDVPTSKDFEESGTGFLNLAWENTLTLLLNADDWELPQEDQDAKVRAEYWASAHRFLITAAALAQQGIEFLLKGKIAAISPFLLLSGEPQKWPKAVEGRIPFADFRTIDAQDLIRVHDSVQKQSLTDEMKEAFEKSRRLRNAIFHTVDRRASVTAAEILRTILVASDCLLGPTQWVGKRREFVNTSPEAIPSGGDHADILIIRELNQVVKCLSNAEIERFIGLKKDGRRYLCYWCHWNCRDVWVKAEARFAQLIPNEPTSTWLHCYACGKDSKVLRIPCTNGDCKSNVIDKNNLTCSVCYEFVEE